ncbi:MAG: hypothetical protein O7G85_03330, partial [Planctomycetota bacterium]|nr:hypothetical protein [Planctomycetota bacterium]
MPLGLEEGDRNNVTSVAGGLKLHHDLLNPKVVEDIRRWRDHPELGLLYANLQAHAKKKIFFDSYAEAMVARHLLMMGCDLRFEVETPKGKTCDFEVTSPEGQFYLHVKRLYTDRPTEKKLTISSRLRVLERIERPYIVGVRWPRILDDEEMQRFVTLASEFVLQARVGDEHVVLDTQGEDLGGVRIVAPSEGRHVILMIGLPSGFIDETRRIEKLLRKAYEQFMPKAPNVILFGTSHTDDLVDFESVLLGEHVERWDAFPPRGQRIAHGRAADGFWKGSSRTDSAAVGWFHFDPLEATMNARLWFREDHPVE